MNFTTKQSQYIAFIYNYTKIHGQPYSPTPFAASILGCIFGLENKTGNTTKRPRISALTRRILNADVLVELMEIHG